MMGIWGWTSHDVVHETFLVGENFYGHQVVIIRGNAEEKYKWFSSVTDDPNAPHGEADTLRDAMTQVQDATERWLEDETE